MERLPITVVVPVSNDKRIGKCIDSVDENAEIVVVLNNNPTTEVVDIVRISRRCKIIIINEKGCNLARVFNEGIKSATHDKIMLMNSDCTFQPGLIREASRQLDFYDVVKARVVFDYEKYSQYLVSQCRYLFHHIFDGGKNLYGPGLSFKKSILNMIGGYFFDERMGWGEDGELSNRIKSSSLKIMILKQNVDHGKEGMIHDLKIAYKIGKGSGIKNRKNGVSIKDALTADLRHILKDQKRQFRLAYKHGGPVLVNYFLLWKIVFHLGFYEEILKRRYDGGR
ncbi:MAG: glycosyltransferase [bacterium]|nr:glycosyltransferase [bacterium]